MSKKEEIIYHFLALPYPGYLNQSHSGFLNMGNFQVEKLPPEAIIEVMDAYIELFGKILSCPGVYDDNKRLFLGQNFITYKEYEQMFKAYRDFARESRAADNLLKYENRETKHELIEKRNPFPGMTQISAQLKEVLQLHCKVRENVNEKSYVRLLRHQNLAIAPFFSSTLPFQMAEEAMERHTLLTGNSGAGKSTLLKRLIQVCVKGKQSSVVVIDPAGDMAREVAQFPEFQNQFAHRLIYVDPTIRDGFIPVFNPLDLKDTSDENVHLATEELVATFKELLSKSGGADLTTNMHALLYPCIATLIKMGGKTLFDLQRFLQNDADLVEQGKRSTNPAVATFFETAFSKKKFDPTKLSLYTKLQSFLNSPIFGRMVAQSKSSIDLEDALNRGKILVINLAKGAMGTDTSEALGRFIIASIKGLVQKRWDKPKADKRPIYLIVDEIQNYLTPSVIEILRESRKYGLHMVASTQYITDMEQKVQNAFLSVTNIKITGKNALSTLSAMAKETGASLAELQALKCGIFSFKVDTARPVTVTVPPPEKHIFDQERWKQLVDLQIQQYYRPLGLSEEQEEILPMDEVEPKVRKAKLEI